MALIKNIAIKITVAKMMKANSRIAFKKPAWLNNRWFLGASVFYALMFILGSVRSLERSVIWTFNDKLLHFVAYSIITALIYLGLKSRPIGEFLLPRFLSCLAIVLLAGALDEIGQFFVGRDSSFDDWLADAAAAVVLLIGVAFAHALIWAWQQFRGPNPEEDES
jgi:VanZ family protein